MQAACYGRAFCPPDSFPRKRILEVCRHLKLLNTLRQPEIGIPMTMAQLEAHGPPSVLTRLVSAKKHLLALRIATMLDLNPEQAGPIVLRFPVTCCCPGLAWLPFKVALPAQSQLVGMFMIPITEAVQKFFLSSSCSVQYYLQLIVGSISAGSKDTAVRYASPAFSEDITLVDV